MKEPKVKEIIDHYGESLFQSIDDRLNKQERVIVAIDGDSASGKSTLACNLQKVYQGGVIRMDHFFLRPEQRTKRRLNEIGGNIDYERFHSEVSKNLLTGNRFAYRIYDCASCSFIGNQTIDPERLVVIEGVYSRHPNLDVPYDLRVFMSVDRTLQQKLIESRDGTELLRRYREEWIPKEKEYFQTFKVKETSDICIVNQYKY